MAKEYVNKEALNINGGPLEAVMKAYVAEKSPQHMAAFIEALNRSRFLVPIEFPNKLSQDIVERLKKGEQVSPEEMPKMFPILLKNKDGVHFAPAFTSKEQLPKEHNYMGIMPVGFADILRVSRVKEYNIKGIILNPATDKVILADQMLDLMEKVVKGADITAVMEEAGFGKVQKKTLSMTVEQFHVFARRNVELGLLPKLAFQNKDQMVDTLEKKGPEFLFELYKGMYRANVPYPYTEQDFDVMTLQIRDDLTISSIVFPTKHSGAGACTSGYVVWNPQTEQMRYYAVEKAKDAEASRLIQVTPDGKLQMIAEAPAPGSEMYTIIEIMDKQET